MADDETGGAGRTCGRRLMRGERLVLASHNAGKLAEIRALLAPHGLEVVAAGALRLAEPEEDAPDFAGNARIKALVAAEATGLAALADDSGFCVAALGGAPGVLSARWAGPQKDFAGAMGRVAREIGGAADRSAWFCCALCLAWPDGHSETVEGRVDGQVVWPPRGRQGFGYDPMFQPHGGTTTYGEVDRATKGGGSHRARAFAALLARCLPAG